MVSSIPTMRDEQTMTLICFTGVNDAENPTHVQLCLGTEGDARPENSPYFFTVTIADAEVAAATPGRRRDAQRHRLPLARKDLIKLRGWLDQVIPADETK